MEESFSNKINASWDKGWNSNNNFSKAKRFISIVARGEETKEELKKREIEEMEL